MELIIVIAIISLLASLAFMAMSGETGEARDTRRISDIKNIEDLIVTSNAKSLSINHGSSTAEITTNLGVANGVNPLRGAYLVSVAGTLFNLATASPNTDPKGTSYIAGFINNNSYQIIGAEENPETGIPTAIVSGSFREGVIVDQTRAAIGLVTDEILVSNPDQFVAGDVITIDNEDMVVAGYNAKRSTIAVLASSVDIPPRSDGVVGNMAVHSKGAKIKLKYLAPRAGGIFCLGKLDTLASGSWATQAGAVQGVTTAVVVPIRTADPASANVATAGLPTTVAEDWTGGKVCANTATSRTSSSTYADAQTTVNITSGDNTIPLGIIIDEGTTVPYNPEL